MQMSTLKGWHGGHLEEAPKEELRHLTLRGIVTVGVCHSHLLHTSFFPLNLSL